MRDYLSALLDFVGRDEGEKSSKDVIVQITEPLKKFPDHGPLIKRVLAARTRS